MPAALQSSQSKVSQVRSTSSRCAPIHNGANRKHTFTAEEVLCFLQSKGLIEIAKATDFVTDADIECIVKSSGFTRPHLEDKIVEAAFETLASGLPKIPPDNVVKMLEFSKAKKLGAAYKIAHKISWSSLKNDLNAKRAEILEGYRKYLISDVVIERCDMDKAQATGHNFPSTFSRRIPGMKVDAPPSSQPRIPAPHFECTSSMEPMENHTPTPTISKNRDEEHHPPRKAEKESSGRRAWYRNGEVGQTNIPCYVTLRRKKGFKRQEVRQNTLKNVPGIDDNSRKRKSGHTLHASQNCTGRTDERLDKPILMTDRNGGDPEGNTPGSAGGECRKRETMSVRTDILDAFQLAQSPESLPEKEEFGFSDEDDWTDEASPAIQSGALAKDSAKSGPVESPTTITLRKLAEMREQILEEKRTGVWQQRIRLRQQQRDFMNSPDSDYTFSDACRSPRPRQQCTFAFRGFRIEAPAAAERPSRQRHPAWYVREDLGSPTPMRVVLRGR
ncbi:hypothetical protein A7U60_g7136 [Sanghuangporus baumii]|uniref:Uncharacterized protein n=1 Tax=Sanghuangporus baumii TaxID=108892 RepID=A0A9Q5HTW7_SANBA|nr:hypothetical protein A7U60_g7136 [Sanghuangporus baumii]